MLRKRDAMTITEGTIVVVIIGLLAALLLLGVQRACQGHAPRAACHQRLKHIALALYNYQYQKGHFPPAYTVDDKGSRLHSWRTLILPYLEQTTLYNSIDLAKPWDDPANAQAYARALDVYRCPASHLRPGMTTYLAPVGADWPFSGDNTRSLNEIGYEAILVMEVDPKSAVHWMSPYDFEDTDSLPFDASREGVHQGSLMVALSGGQVESIDRRTSLEEFHEMLSISDDHEESQ